MHPEDWLSVFKQQDGEEIGSPFHTGNKANRKMAVMFQAHAITTLILKQLQN